MITGYKKQKNMRNVGSEDTAEITITEIRHALKQMKIGKVPGSDGVLSEMLLEGSTALIKELKALYNKCLDYRKALDFNDQF